jgi:dGTPase
VPQSVVDPSVDREHRRHDGDKGPDQRSPFQRDRDRILYSSAFRRLGAITQVVSPTEHAFVHNRLTHTLKVAQIARRLAERLNQDGIPEDIVNPDIAEAAALAHDLGHPPFGHIAEDELDRLALERNVLDGFNGNAQSFRIVTRLAVRNTDFPGLNLTRATLDAILKYPWFRATSGSGQHKWGAYHSEEDEFGFARHHHTDGSRERSVEADIMDWADDIAYAIHDVEDFFRAGLIPLPFLLSDDGERESFLRSALERMNRGSSSPYTIGEIGSAFDEAIAPLPVRVPFRGGGEQRAELRFATGALIGTYISALGIETDAPNTPRVTIGDRAKLHVGLLKQLTWHYVIESPSLATQQHGQRHVVRRLFEIYCNEAHSPVHPERRGYQIFPEYYRELLRAAPDDDMRTRLVIDLIASMTEQQALEMFQRLTGVSLGSAMDHY